MKGNKTMKFLVFSILILLFSNHSNAAEFAAAITAEITHLITYLEKSGCEFDRNGSKHNAKEASAHLQKKYQYLLDHNMVASAEDFIAKAGSESSISGKPYHVQCAGVAPVESGQWFKDELDSFRKQKQ